VQFSELILRQRLSGIQIHRPRRRIAQDLGQDRAVVAERLAGRGRGDDDDVAAGEGVGHRLSLVGVELLDALLAEHLHQPRIHRLGERRVDRRGRRDAVHRRDHPIRGNRFSHHGLYGYPRFLVVRANARHDRPSTEASQSLGQSLVGRVRSRPRREKRPRSPARCER
jgi:hypothetical protein